MSDGRHIKDEKSNCLLKGRGFISHLRRFLAACSHTRVMWALLALKSQGLLQPVITSCAARDHKWPSSALPLSKDKSSETKRWILWLV